MSIARISSLFVLGALALSACVVSTNDGDDTGGSGGRSGSSGSTTGGGAGKAGSSGGSGQAGSDSDASAGAAGQAGLGGSAGAAGADGSAGGAAGQTGSAGEAGGGAAGQGGGAGADSGACDDSVGTHPDCSGISPNCSLPAAQTSCEQAPNHFKPRVAQNVSSCIVALTPDEQCSPTELYTCFDAALRAACDDASAAVSCTAIVGACPIIAAAQCRLYLSGMTASARASMTACMSSILNGCNLPGCIRAL